MFCWNLQNLPVSKSLDRREYFPIPGFNESMSYCIFVNACEYLPIPGFNESILSCPNVFVQSQSHWMIDFISFNEGPYITISLSHRYAIFLCG